jgi:error-prone DNA polymerase
VPELRKDESQNLAACGALNPLDRKNQLHRRDALWQVAKFGRPVGPLLQEIPDYDPTSVLLRMSDIERLVTDHHISGFTIGPHAMAYRRDDLNRMNLSTLRQAKNSVPGAVVRTAGEVTVKQRPGTAKGIVFLTLHDETDFCDVVLKPAVYEEHRMVVKNSKFLRVHGNKAHMSCLSMRRKCFRLSSPGLKLDHVISIRVCDSHILNFANRRVPLLN